ncbi:MAG: zinc ribbon domain-containing protein [Thermoplasmata archaeon]|nr:zinc ribbon domain-containing protein [Thermoplasmata archaeon]
MQVAIAGTLAVIGGIIPLLFGGFLIVLLIGSPSLYGTGTTPALLPALQQSLAVIAGILVLVGGVLLLTRPHATMRWALLLLVASALSLAGGILFVPTFTLGILGGILALIPSETPTPPWWTSPHPPPGWSPWPSPPTFWIRFCPACGTGLAPGARFCSACGGALPSPPPTAPPPP